MSQAALGNELDLTFQQVQKYEKGTNKIGVGRLMHISQILQVPVAFFFEDGPDDFKATGGLPDYVCEFMSTPEGLALTRAFMKISDTKMRSSVVALVEQLASEQKPTEA